MKLWLLRPIVKVDDMTPESPWWNGWDCCFGFVVRAEDEASARAVIPPGYDETDHPPPADMDDFIPGNEGSHTWRDPKLTTCIELTGDGPAGVIIRDFHAG